MVAEYRSNSYAITLAEHPDVTRTGRDREWVKYSAYDTLYLIRFPDVNSDLATFPGFLGRLPAREIATSPTSRGGTTQC